MQMMFTAGSEMRKGFTMPTVKKIKSVLRTRSKTFLINLIMSMMIGMSKTAKIKVLIKIDRRKVTKGKKRKTTRKGGKRKTARRAYKKFPKGTNGRRNAPKGKRMRAGSP